MALRNAPVIFEDVFSECGPSAKEFAPRDKSKPHVFANDADWGGFSLYCRFAAPSSISGNISGGVPLVEFRR
jgi:hypothetical protein